MENTNKFQLSSLKKLLNIKEMISDDELSVIDQELSFLPDEDKSLLLNHITNH